MMGRVALAATLLASCAPAHRTALTASAHPFRDAPEPTSTTTTTSTTEPPTTTTTRATTTTAPQRASRSRSSGCAGWEDLVDAYSWPTDTACRVLLCESRGDPDAANPSGAHGLFQVLGGPFDAAANVSVAFSMWQTRGWQPWVSSAGCWS